MDEVNDGYSVSEEVVINTPTEYPLVNCTRFNVSVDAVVSSGENLTENYILDGESQLEKKWEQYIQ